MKMKSLFFGMLALAAMTSCSNNDDEAAVVDNGTKAVSLSFDYGTASRAIGAPGVAGAPTLTNVKVEFFSTLDGTGTAAKVVTLTDAEMKASPVTIMAPASANSIRMVANNAASSMSKDILDYQGKDLKVGIPYEGIAEITPAGAGYSAAIKLNPVVARVEVSGYIKPAAATWKVEIIGVYANNFLTTLGTPSLFTLLGDKGVVTGSTLTGMFDLEATDGPAWATAFPKTEIAATKCASYHMFPGSYGLTLQLKVERNSVIDPILSTTRFLVIKGFNPKGSSTPIANLVGGTIYNLDLSSTDLGKSFTDTLDPTSETPDGSKSVAVGVTVTSWSVQNVTPNI